MRSKFLVIAGIWAAVPPSWPVDSEHTLLCVTPSRPQSGPKLITLTGMVVLALSNVLSALGRLSAK
ncbi:hypothetical protein PLICRDRAFT_36892 [Plicaturopsis crispa FD-325 SS-3]|nr:hypothetical protein PLICRDRAFT_36892 [Plicaturopsis crispa FD-325 SS-3]